MSPFSRYAPPPPVPDLVGVGGAALGGLSPTVRFVLAGLYVVALNACGWAFSTMAETGVPYDLFGSLSFLLLCAYTRSGAVGARAALATGALALWAARLGYFLFSRALRDGQDRRLTPYVRDPLQFLVLWAVQAAWAVASALPVVALNLSRTDAPLGMRDAAVAALWVLAAGAQALADEQKRAFRADPRNRGRFIATGLWRYSRHPNYFFDILAQWALAAFCLPGLWAGCGPFWGSLAAAGPALHTLLLLCVSGVPLLEAQGKQKWGDDRGAGGYMQYVENTSLLVPWPPRGAPAAAKRRY